jgi:arylsulfatase A
MNRRTVMQTAFATAAGLAAGPGSLFAAGKQADPNIIVIMADDIGYGDLGCYGATEIKTPNIDRLAKEGLRFTSGYCSAATCTPTRFSLLTGKYAFRQHGTGIAAPNATALIQPGTVTLPSILKKAGYSTAIVGKWHLGLGKSPAPDWNGELNPGPREAGFDYSFVLPTTNDRVPNVYVENGNVHNLDPADPLWVEGGNRDNQPTGVTHRDTLRMDWSDGHNQTIHNGIGRIGYFGGGQQARWRDEDLADMWMQKSVQWIKEQESKPFFLFFASHDIHVPRMPHERFQGSTSLGYRGDAIAELDWSVGKLLETLDELKLADNTLVIFCSDNGPVLDDGYKDGAVEKLGKHTPGGPLRAGKGSVYEGGTRTPFIARWPRAIRPGTSDNIVCTIDLAASFAALTGQALDDSACPDSFNVLPALLGKPGAAGREYLVQQGNDGVRLGLRAGDWKLIYQETKYRLFNLSDASKGSKNVIKRESAMANQLKAKMAELERNGSDLLQHGKGNRTLTLTSDNWKLVRINDVKELYNLRDDIGETRNLIGSEPERAAQLLEKLATIRSNNRSRP